MSTRTCSACNVQKIKGDCYGCVQHLFYACEYCFKLMKETNAFQGSAAKLNANYKPPPAAAKPKAKAAAAAPKPKAKATDEYVRRMRLRFLKPVLISHVVLRRHRHVFTKPVKVPPQKQRVDANGLVDVISCDSCEAALKTGQLYYSCSDKKCAYDLCGKCYDTKKPPPATDDDDDKMLVLAKVAEAAPPEEEAPAEEAASDIFTIATRRGKKQSSRRR